MKHALARKANVDSRFMAMLDGCINPAVEARDIAIAKHMETNIGFPMSETECADIEITLTHSIYGGYEHGVDVFDPNHHRQWRYAHKFWKWAETQNHMVDRTGGSTFAPYQGLFRTKLAERWGANLAYRWRSAPVEAHIAFWTAFAGQVKLLPDVSRVRLRVRHTREEIL